MRLTTRDAQPRGPRSPTCANPTKLRRQRATAAKQQPRQPPTTTAPNQRHPRKSVCVTHLAVWSNGMIPASGAGGPGFNSRNSPNFPTHKYRYARTCKPTPVGFEPTRGDPIGLAGRRLNQSAKLSLARTPWTAERTPLPANPPSQTKDRTCALRTNTPTTITSKRPRGPMDKASAHGAGNCRFESCRGHLRPAPTAKPGGAGKNRHQGDSNPCGQSP